MGQWTKTYDIDHVLLTGNETLLQATLSAAGQRANYFPSLEDLLERLLQLIGPETTVLVKGANSARMDKIIDALIEVTHHAAYTE
jgi:UDP-N-acetylmuramyl pentapeptide synthase